jgi:hypothetical protein
MATATQTKTQRGAVSPALSLSPSARHRVAVRPQPFCAVLSACARVAERCAATTPTRRTDTFVCSRVHEQRQQLDVCDSCPRIQQSVVARPSDTSFNQVLSRSVLVPPLVATIHRPGAQRPHRARVAAVCFWQRPTAAWSLSHTSRRATPNQLFLEVRRDSADDFTATSPRCTLALLARRSAQHFVANVAICTPF